MRDADGPRSARGLWRMLTVPGMRPGAAVALARAHPTWSALADAGAAALVRVGGAPAAALAHGVPDAPLPRTVDADVLGFFDDGYPDALRTIPNPPAVLWVRGALPGSGVAVVGTRQPTPPGAVIAQRIAAAAVARGLPVVAGLSPGIDVAAHRAVVEAAGVTVAVLGSGIDALPAGTDDLAHTIVGTGGALVSEVAPGLEATRARLDARDRIQSGLSAGVIVVQAALGCPTLHTARFAIVQERVLATVATSPEVDPDAARNAGNRALADPDGVDPLLLHASGRLGAAIANRRPCADVVIRSGEDLPVLWRRLG